MSLKALSLCSAAALSLCAAAFPLRIPGLRAPDRRKEAKLFFEDPAWVESVRTNTAARTFCGYGRNAFVRTMADELMLAHGPAGSADDAPVRAIAEEYAWASWNEIATRLEMRNLGGRAKKLLDAGARPSPLMRWLAALDGDNAQSLADMMRLDKEVKPTKENAFLRFRMAVNMRIADKKESFPSRQGIAAARFADWLDARGEACGRVFAYWAARRSYLLADGTLLQILKLRKGVDPWLMAVAEIAGETEAAWRSRGGGYADKVTSAGWSGWATHAANAKVALERAREIHPDLPEPAFLCARVFFPTSGDAECDELFRWASSNFLDDPDFLDKYMFYKCYPRWCGSPERMKSFADACAATCRDDTLLPFFGVKSMLNVAKEGGPSLDATFSDDARYARSIAVLETVLTNGIFRLGRSYWQALHILPAVHYFKGKYEKTAEAWNPALLTNEAAEKAGAWYMFDDYSALFMTITGLVGPNSAKMAALHRMYNSHDYLGFLSAAEKVKKEGGLSNKEQVFLERQSANATALCGDPSRWVKASFANWKADVINYGRTWQYKNHAWHIGRNSSMSKVLQWTVQFPQDAEFEIVVRSWDTARPSMASFGFRVGVGDTRSLPLVHVARDDTRLGVAFGPSHESPRSDSLQERFRWTEVRGAETKVRIECKGGCVRAWINDGAEPAVVSETHGLDNERPEDGGLRLRIMGDNVEVVSLRGHAAAK